MRSWLAVGLLVSALLPSWGCVSSMGCVLAEARAAEEAAQQKKDEEEKKEQLRSAMLLAAKAGDADRGAVARQLVLPLLPASRSDSPVTKTLGIVDAQKWNPKSEDLLAARDVVGPADVAGAEDDVKKAEDKYKGTEEHFGVQWGFGPAIVGDGTREIESATITDGRVNVTESRQYQPKILLETHKFLAAFYDCESDPAKRKQKVKDGHSPSDDMLVGFGPFVALALGGDDVIDGIGFGLMVGGKVGQGTSFNVGVGPYLASKIQVLADGFVDGEAAPAGATEVEFTKRSDWKSLVMFSFSWSF